MKLKALLAGLLLVGSASSAFAAGPYISGAGGVTFVHDSEFDGPEFGSPDAEYDTGFGFNFGVGYRMEPVRVEFEFGYKNADVEKVGGVDVNGGDLTVFSYMANFFYDFRISAPVTPYAGAGIGAVHGKFEVRNQDSSDTTFGYQLIGGIAYPIDKNLTLDLSYRFQSAPGNFKEEGVSVDYNSSNVLFGARWNF